MDAEAERRGNSLNSPKLGYPVDAYDDEKYVSGLSTILVASIQDAKDRISQIEYIFCSQLYPNLRSKSKTLQKFYKSLQNQWNQRENELLLQIEGLREENRLLKEKAPREHDLFAKQWKIEELQRELGKKGEEVDEGIELQKSFVELVQSKGSSVMEREKQLKSSEKKRQGVIARVHELEEQVKDLMELRVKMRAQNLELGSEIENSERERKRLLVKIDDLDGEAAEIRRKLEEGEELKKQLSQQVEMKSLELLDNKRKLDVYEKENTLLVDKVKCLEEKINGMDSYTKLLEQVESVTLELQAAKKKRNQVTDAYKRLKSQHNYLRGKVRLTPENMFHQNKLVNESSLSKQKSSITVPGFSFDNPHTTMDGCKTAKVKSEVLDDDFGGLENRTADTFVAACDKNKVKEEALEDEKEVNLSRPSSSLYCDPKRPSIPKSVPVSGTKQPASSWRQTRPHQSRGGPDPHDDFLDTPLENIRENLNKGKEDLPDPIQEDINMGSSGDKTRDLIAKSSPAGPQKNQSSIPVANKRGFKYIEPVRKKAERENLEGVECKQCRKFYEAVLPKADGKDPDSSKKFCCEHHDGVSRHRYRYVPPMTPEGFWNIGFESEI